MLLHIALVTEILATIFCIHCIYGEKAKLDIRTIGAILGILITLEIANTFQKGGIFSIVGYFVLFAYCKSEFRSSFTETIISILLYIIVLTSIQFICVSLVNLIISDQHIARNAIGNICVLIICIKFLPKVGLHRLQISVCKRSRYVIGLFGFMGVIILFMLLQEKVFYKIQMQYFIFAIPAIIMLLYSILKWYTAQIEAEKMEDKIRKVEETTKEYESLLTKVRLRQHELKNHMAAIFSAHYTHKTYENLVNAQEEYCKKLMMENRYNNLLLLGNNILAGYLYGKFQEIEEDGIEIDYKVTAKMDRSKVPTYHIIEMLGILLDNAVEALKCADEKCIFVEICETECEYQFLIMNPYRYVSYNEILEWFQFEKSEKGNGRGLGLYHLKTLCDEWKCDIACRNIEIKQENRIVFTLKIKKTDNI